jgi:putative sterol carrier protein
LATLEDITAKLREAMENAPPGGWGLSESLKFDLLGEGVIFVHGREVVNDDRPADCTFVLSKAVFEDLARGRLDPAMAMMRGRLKILGDLAVAMKLKPILERALG